MSKKLKGVSGHPRAARPMHGCKKAWCYENPKSLDVYITDGANTFACRIPRAVLADWIRRTEPEVKA